MVILPNPDGYVHTWEADRSAITVQRIEKTACSCARLGSLCMDTLDMCAQRKADVAVHVNVHGSMVLTPEDTGTPPTCRHG